MKKANKVRYENLSGWLKAAVISAYICGSLFLMAFIAGFFEAMLGVE